MIIVDRFIYVHAPKTGGTFVTDIIKRIHREHSEYGEVRKEGKKHDGCKAIPFSERGKPILGSVRCPYDWYVSDYEFGWWKLESERAWFETVPGFEKYTTFPDISFADWLLLQEAAYRLPEERNRVYGSLTRRFVRFYFRDPLAVLQNLDAEYIANKRFREDMFPVHFLRTGRLNEDLYRWLLSVGYKQDHVEFVRSAGRILPEGSVRKATQTWQEYFTPSLMRHVRDRDRLVFDLFPECDVSVPGG